ncbi:MAG: cytochrome c3 family protein [Syntrophorhabdaceae bacterium]|nr:cytochrome c3 family protein [Syntrophorhabdaceae bacterium]
MKKEATIALVLAVVGLFALVLLPSAFAQKKAPESMMLKLEGGKFPPVPFSHPAHTDKAKVDCVACHHKDKNPKEPDGCMPCHDRKDPKNGALPIKDAYHKNCTGCHKESSAKGVAAPTKCNDCHKKQ